LLSAELLPLIDAQPDISAAQRMRQTLVFRRLTIKAP
jgi:hypothetical protein